MYHSKSCSSLLANCLLPSRPPRNTREHEQFYLSYFDEQINGARKNWYKTEVRYNLLSLVRWFCFIINKKTKKHGNNLSPLTLLSMSKVFTIQHWIGEGGKTFSNKKSAQFSFSTLDLSTMYRYNKVYGKEACLLTIFIISLYSKLHSPSHLVFVFLYITVGILTRCIWWYLDYMDLAFGGSVIVICIDWC